MLPKCFVSGQREQALLNLNPQQASGEHSSSFNQQLKKKEKIDIPLYNMEFNEFEKLTNKMKKKHT